MQSIRIQCEIRILISKPERTHWQLNPLFRWHLSLMRLRLCGFGQKQVYGFHMQKKKYCSHIRRFCLCAPQPSRIGARNVLRWSTMTATASQRVVYVSRSKRKILVGYCGLLASLSGVLSIVFVFLIKSQTLRNCWLLVVCEQHVRSARPQLANKTLPSRNTTPAMMAQITQ